MRDSVDTEEVADREPVSVRYRLAYVGLNVGALEG